MTEEILEPLPVITPEQPAPVVSKLSRNPASVIIYGVAKTGKSSDALKTYSKGLWLVHSPNVMDAYKSEIEAEFEARGEELDDEKLNALVPKHIVCHETKLDADGNEVEIDNYQFLQEKLRAFQQRCRADEALPEGDPRRRDYTALVLDEATVFFKRALKNMQNIDVYAEHRSRAGKLDMFAVYRTLGEFERYLLRVVPQACKKTIVLICNEKPPTDNEGIRTLGGPDLASQGVAKDATHDADAVLQFLKRRKPDALGNDPEKDYERVILTSPDDYYRRGIRSRRVAAVEKGDLTSVLSRARIAYG
jgi:hypothetical protein